MDSFSEVFFNKAFWLPKDSSWEEVTKYTNFNLGQYVGTCLVLAVVMTLIRRAFEKLIGYPLGAYFGVQGVEKYQPHAKLEQLYGDNKQTLNSSVAMVS